MISPLVINIRCVCIEEFVEMKKIHEIYKKQKIEGEITSAYVGADRKLYGLDKSLDKMLDKVYGDGARPIITERITKEKVVAAQGNGDGTVTETIERTYGMPEKPLDLDEARAIGAGYAEQEEELAFDPSAEDYRAESKDWKVREEPKPEITLTDVLTALAEESDPMEAIKTEAEGEPDGDEQDYNTTYAG